MLRVARMHSPLSMGLVKPTPQRLPCHQCADRCRFRERCVRCRAQKSLAVPLGGTVDARTSFVLRLRSVEIHSAARKHDCADSDIHHAVEHRLVVNDVGDDDSPYRLLVIGPDQSGNLLEIIVLIFDDERRIGHSRHADPTQVPLPPSRAWSNRCLKRRFMEPRGVTSSTMT